MALQIEIAGVDVSVYLQPGSLRLSKTLNNRWRADMSLCDKLGGLLPDVGSRVNIYDGATHLFGGFLWDYTYSTPGGTFARFIEAHCVDHTLLVDRRYFRLRYEGKKPGEIIRDIFARPDVVDDAIGTTHVTDGSVIDLIEWAEPTSLAQILSDLAEREGCSWWIDPSRQLYFQPLDAIEAPFGVFDDGVVLVANSLKVTNSMEDYANGVILWGGMRPSDQAQETFEGDFTAKEWDLAADLIEAPTITLNGNTVTVGLYGTDTGKDYYWSQNSRTVRQDDLAVPIGYGDFLVVTYRLSTRLQSGGDDTGQQTERAGVESSAGKWQIVERDETITTDAAASERIASLLRRFSYGTTAKKQTVVFETDFPGLDAGQRITIQREDAFLDGQFLIDQIDGRDMECQFIRWTAKCQLGEHGQSAAEFFKELGNGGSSVAEARIDSDTVTIGSTAVTY